MSFGALCACGGRSSSSVGDTQVMRHGGRQVSGPLSGGSRKRKRFALRSQPSCELKADLKGVCLFCSVFFIKKKKNCPLRDSLYFSIRLVEESVLGKAY